MSVAESLGSPGRIGLAHARRHYSVRDDADNADVIAAFRQLGVAEFETPSGVSLDAHAIAELFASSAGRQQFLTALAFAEHERASALRAWRRDMSFENLIAALGIGKRT